MAFIEIEDDKGKRLLNVDQIVEIGTDNLIDFSILVRDADRAVNPNESYVSFKARLKAISEMGELCLLKEMTSESQKVFPEHYNDFENPLIKGD